MWSVVEGAIQKSADTLDHDGKEIFGPHCDFVSESNPTTFLLRNLKERRVSRFLEILERP
jgi:hypothetical protein